MQVLLLRGEEAPLNMQPGGNLISVRCGKDAVIPVRHSQCPGFVARFLPGDVSKRRHTEG